MIEESKYCSDVMKKHFDKESVMTKEINEDFENASKYWTCDNVYVKGDNVYVKDDVKIRDHWYISGKYRVSAHRDCNINFELNHKIPIVFYNLKHYDSPM